MKKILTRREFLHYMALLSGSALLPRQLMGNDDGNCFNGKNVLGWIVPNAAGGGYDRYSRLIAPFLAGALHREIAIQNFPGAGGIIGARRIQNAPPDGSTFGIINAPGLLASHLSGETNVPNPLKDFTLLAQISNSRQVWITARQSGIDSMEKLFEIGKKRPLVCGTRGVSSLGFVNTALNAHLLGIEVEIVPGYLGSNAGVLAAMRGEVDFVAYNFYSIQHHLASRDMQALLQISTSKISDTPLLQNVPVLGGENGLAVKRAASIGKNTTQSEADAAAIINLLGAGRILVAPLDLTEAVRDCLRNNILKVLNDPALAALAEKSGLQLHILDADAVQHKLNSIAERAGNFIPVLKTAIEKVRQ